MFEELSIRENVELPFRLGGHPASGHPASERAARLSGLLDDLGLTALASRLPAEVSLGEHHRALVHYAKRVLRISDGLLDEVQAGDVVAAGDEL